MPDDLPAASAPRFAAGSRVRVRPGIMDPDYPDFPLGGWVGTVQAVDEVDPNLYLIAWTEETLAAAHPVYHRRCQRDDLEVERTWLTGNDLEVDPGGPLVLALPTALAPRPLDLDVPEERALSILGLTSDDELPPIQDAGLARFHAHLQTRLSFPFVARYTPSEQGTQQPVLVLRLLPVEQSEAYGELLVEVSLDGENQTAPLGAVHVAPDDRGADDLAAYAVWLESDTTNEVPQPVSMTHPFLLVALLSGVLGAMTGAIWNTLPDIRWISAVAAGLVGVIGVLFGTGYEMLFRRINHQPPGILGGGLLGLMAGALVGAFLGALVIAYPGALLGAMGGTILSRILAAFDRRWLRPIHWTLASAGVGAVVYVYLLDAQAAARGTAWGALGGAALGGLGIALGIVYLMVAFDEQDPPR